jgi:site-specific recombinase XerD
MLTTEQPPKKLLDQVRDLLRIKHYSYRTEQSYVAWIRRYILFHNKRHPNEMGIPEIEAFLSYLAINENLAASTQNVTLSALLFLYKQVLFIELPYIDQIERARKPARLPVVFTEDEARAILSKMGGVHHLIASLLYGSGLRLTECLALRVKVSAEILVNTVSHVRGTLHLGRLEYSWVMAAFGMGATLASVGLGNARQKFKQLATVIINAQDQEIAQVIIIPTC